jgi:hypothetical protein
MLAPPNFGRVLSNDRFTRIMRYLARDPDGTETLNKVILGQKYDGWWKVLMRRARRSSSVDGSCPR